MSQSVVHPRALPVRNHYVKGRSTDQAHIWMADLELGAVRHVDSERAKGLFDDMFPNIFRAHDSTPY